jgi:1,4-dihydroxy-2-naphthoate octaprenyltransferase
METTGIQKPSPVRVWLLAARPKTLPAGIVPVLAGGALAYGDGDFHGWAVAAALFCSVLIQVGTNLTNDLFDFRKNTDTTERTGPVRVTQAGLVTPQQIAAAIAVVFALAVAAGTYLVFRGGWPIVAVGLVSILCGVLYTAGPWALAYIGLGDLFVLVFYGPVALAGTYYVQTLTLDWRVVLAGVPFGLISTAILVVNNLRDIDTDRKSGKNTLAVRFGRTFARLEYTALIVAAALLAPAFVWRLDENVFLLLPLLYLVPAAPAVATVWRTASGAVLNRTLAATGRLLVVYGILFCAGWLL